MAPLIWRNSIGEILQIHIIPVWDLDIGCMNLEVFKPHQKHVIVDIGEWLSSDGEPIRPFRYYNLVLERVKYMVN